MESFVQERELFRGALRSRDTAEDFGLQRIRVSKKATIYCLTKLRALLDIYIICHCQVLTLFQIHQIFFKQDRSDDYWKINWHISQG